MIREFCNNYLFLKKKIYQNYCSFNYYKDMEETLVATN